MSLKQLFAFLGIGFLFSGCVSQYKVFVEFSPLLQEHFSEFPTIEVDIAAVTEGEASEVKQAGVEQYFAPNSGTRDRLQPQTCFFSQEDNVSFVLPSRALVWKTWLDKKPTDLLVIASLPHNPSITPQSDPRYVLIKMQKSYILAKTIYVLVEPQKVIRISKSSATGDANTPQESEQWIEARKRRSR